MPVRHMVGMGFVLPEAAFVILSSQRHPVQSYFVQGDQYVIRLPCSAEITAKLHPLTRTNQKGINAIS